MTAVLLADDPAPSAPAGGQQAAPFNPLPFILIFGLFFLVVMLPAQRRQRREQAAMLTNIKKGAKVVTSAGIIGIVVNLKENEDEMTIRSEDAKLKVLKSTVVRVIGQDENEAK